MLFLTAKDATENKVEALRAGGDDYVTKPFSLAEIVARVQAILRRSAGDLPGRRAPLRRPRPRREPPRGVPRRDADRADGDRVRAAPLLHAQPAPRALQGADPPERLALRLRRQLERRRDLRQLPPQEARLARPAADQDGAPGRLHARSREDDAQALAAGAARARRAVVVAASGSSWPTSRRTPRCARSCSPGRQTLEADHQGAERSPAGRPRLRRSGLGPAGGAARRRPGCTSSVGRATAPCSTTPACRSSRDDAARDAEAARRRSTFPSRRRRGGTTRRLLHGGAKTAATAAASEPRSSRARPTRWSSRPRSATSTHAAPPARDRAARDAARARGDRPARPLDRPARPAAARRDRRRRRTGSPPATSRSASSAPRADRGRPARARAEHDARPDRGIRPAAGCGASSPTRRTSCARRSPPCAPTRSCSSAAPTSGPTTSSAR